MYDGPHLLPTPEPGVGIFVGEIHRATTGAGTFTTHHRTTMFTTTETELIEAAEDAGRMAYLGVRAGRLDDLVAESTDDRVREAVREAWGNGWAAEQADERREQDAFEAEHDRGRTVGERDEEQGHEAAPMVASATPFATGYAYGYGMSRAQRLDDAARPDEPYDDAPGWPVDGPEFVEYDDLQTWE